MHYALLVHSFALYRPPRVQVAIVKVSMVGGWGTPTSSEDVSVRLRRVLNDSPRKVEDVNLPTFLQTSNTFLLLY